MNWRVPTAQEGLKIIQSILPEDEVRDIAYRNALKYLIDHSDIRISEDDFQ